MNNLGMPTRIFDGSTREMTDVSDVVYAPW